MLRLSFPGGRVDPGDMDAFDTARRECLEEIAMEPLEILGAWHDVPNKNGDTRITPCLAYLGVVTRDSMKHYNSDEVAEVFTVPVADLMNPDLRSTWTSSREF